MPLGRVLVVEDEPVVADMLRDVVTSLGYESEIAGDGPEALRQVGACPPDVVLLDMGLPGMSGVAVLQARETLGLGAFDYVRKPFDVEVLGRVLRAALVYRAR
jgi:DNA-binding response OmpR family regulator